MISAKFVPLKYYTLSSQLRRLTSFSLGLFGSANSVTRSYPVMRKSCIDRKFEIYLCGFMFINMILIIKNPKNIETLSAILLFFRLFDANP